MNKIKEMLLKIGDFGKILMGRILADVTAKSIFRLLMLSKK